MVDLDESWTEVLDVPEGEDLEESDE